MIQLDFPVAAAAEALSRRPREVGFSQHEGGERAEWGVGQAPDRRRNPSRGLPGDGVARELLQREPLARPQRSAGRRLRRHRRPVAPAAPGGRSHPDGEGRLSGRVPLARLRRRLGRGAPQVLRRPDRPEHEDAVDGADHLGERVVARLGLRDPGRQLAGHLDDGLLLRRGRGGVRRPDEARSQPDGRAHRPRRAARHPDLALLAHPLGRDRPVPSRRAGARGARSSPRRSTCTAAGRACSWGSASSSCRSPC